MNSLLGRDRADCEFINGLLGCDRADCEFMNGLLGRDRADCEFINGLHGWIPALDALELTIWLWAWPSWHDEVLA